MKAGKIKFALEKLYALGIEETIVDAETNKALKHYNGQLTSLDDVCQKVFTENQSDINDYKMLFDTVFNSDFKLIEETFATGERVFQNIGFNLDKAKETIYFETDNEELVEEGSQRKNGNSLHFLFDKEVEINLIKAKIRDSDGLELTPTEIIIKNEIGQTFFLEDFKRFFANTSEEWQVFISNLKKGSSIEFVFPREPNEGMCDFKFYKVAYKNVNSLMVKFEEDFSGGSVIKVQKNIADKLKVLKYSVSYDEGVTFEDFNWSNSELEGIEIEDDVQLLTLPNKNVKSVIIRLLPNMDNVSQETEKVLKKERNTQSIDPKFYFDEEDKKYKYILDDMGGKINPKSIKVYLSHKNSKKIKEHNPKLVDGASEEGRMQLDKSYLDMEKSSISEDDIYFLEDFDELESLKVLNGNLGFYRNEELYLPVLFHNEGIGFRVSYDVEYYESSLDLENYTPFIFSINLMVGDSNGS